MSSTSAVVPSASSGAMKMMDKAVSALRAIGINIKSDSNAPILALVGKLAEVDEPRALSIGRTLQQLSAFDALVREQTEAATYGKRYELLAEEFTGLGEDMKQLVGWMEGVEGKPAALSPPTRKALAFGKYPFLAGAATGLFLGNPLVVGAGLLLGGAAIAGGHPHLVTRLRYTLMKLRRGTVGARFERISAVFNEVSNDSRKQLEREAIMLNAYQDMRVAVKESEIDAKVIVAAMQVRVEAKRAAYAQACERVTGASGSEDAVVARLELERDQALRHLTDEEKRLQLARDLSDNLTVSYVAGEAIATRLAQITGVKERLESQSTAFFQANSSNFTLLGASFNALFGLGEQTQALKVMKKGYEDSIRSLGTAGGKVLEAAAREGYRSTIDPEALRVLYTAVVDWQGQVRTIAAEMNAQSDRDREEYGRIQDEGQKRMQAMILRADAPAAVPVAALPAAA